jgi:hypothetical protein
MMETSVNVGKKHEELPFAKCKLSDPRAFFHHV